MQMTMQTLFEAMGYDPSLMVKDVPVDVSELGWEIETWDITKGVSMWSLIKHIVVKDDCNGHHIPEFNLTVSPLHRLWARINKSSPAWIEAHHLVGEHVQLMDVNGSWSPCTVIRSGEKTKILDIEVEGTNSYFSNGVLSHNTIYGDPDTCPGGQAIPFHASVRIKLTSGIQIKAKDKDPKDPRKEDVIAIKVIASTVKNKVSAPRRKAHFEIHFGQGIEEYEQLFDEVNRVGEVEKDGYKISCGGNGTYKEFLVVAADTGEVVHQKKFYKKEFRDVIDNPVWRPFIFDLMDAAFIKEFKKPTLESELEAEQELEREAMEALQSPQPGVTGA